MATDNGNPPKDKEDTMKTNYKPYAEAPAPLAQTDWPRGLDFKPNPRQAPIVQAVEQALADCEAEGAAPTQAEVAARAARLLGVPEDSPWRLPHPRYPFPHGVFGTDVYEARKYVEGRRRRHKTRTALSRLHLKPGLIIGVLEDKQGRTLVNAAVLEVGDTDARIAFNLDGARYQATVSAGELVEMAEKAGNTVFGDVRKKT